MPIMNKGEGVTHKYTMTNQEQEGFSKANEPEKWVWSKQWLYTCSMIKKCRAMYDYFYYDYVWDMG